MDVNDAFRAVDRRDFLPEELHAQAGEDRPLPIGYGQTNSQPYTVRRMLEWLGVEIGQTVLDVGSGSGWTAALLSKLVGRDGKVYAIELVPELVEFGRENCERTAITNVTFHEAGKTIGCPKYSPYDRILVSASAGHMPQELLDQLASPGKMVIPVGESIFEIEKDGSGTVIETEHPGYVFVPLIG